MTTTTNPNAAKPKQYRLRWWFVVGFCVMFFGMAAFWPMLFYNGLGVQQTTLGLYYLLEIGQQLNSTGTLGPTSGNAMVALSIFGVHLIISAVAGVVTMTIVWGIHSLCYERDAAGTVLII